MGIDSIYLNKRDDSSMTSDWVYYRVTGAPGLGVPAGKEGASVQICKVKWPDFSDVGSMVDSPGQVAMASAYLKGIQNVVQAWGIEHDESILIGLLERPDK